MSTHQAAEGHEQLLAEVDRLRARVAELEAQLSAGRCGTYAGYHRHLKKGEDPCEACREGRRARDREYHARNRKQINDRRRAGGA